MRCACPTPPTRANRPLAVAAIALALAGCGGDEGSATVFDEISNLPVRDEFAELSLGVYRVPVPIVLESASDRFEPDNLIQIELELVAIIQPEELDRVEGLLERYGGRLRDQVIRVCRSTARKDLIEPRKSTLKAHLLDAVEPLIGESAVRKLVVKRVNLDEL